MKVLFLAVIITICYIKQTSACGAEIVSAARSQIGVPYSWGGGGINGKSKGIGEGANTVGFDCSGLAQYAVYRGTNKKIGRVASAQYNDGQCRKIPYSQRQPGDLVFYGNSGGIYHVGIASGGNNMIHAPKTGDRVKEANIWTKERKDSVQRCF